MRYFARIDKEQQGPFTLRQLLESGIGPKTYVWGKGMPDWQHADEVADICRGMRRMLAGLDPESGEPLPVPEAADVAPSKSKMMEGEPLNRANMEEYLREAFEEAERMQTHDYSVPPQGVSIISAVIAMILCFPITGILAIYFAWKCKAQWQRSEEAGLSNEERLELRRKSYDSARLYRMMIGITFCMGIIMIGLTLSRTLLA